MNPTLLSFNNGEVSPYLRHRIDLEKAASSAETCENFTATPYGAISKRPGLLHVGMSAAAPQNSHLHPFISTDGSRYLLHFTEDLLTIYREDGTVADTIALLTSTSPTASDSTTGFWSAPLRELQIEAVNDVLFITHPDTHPLRISRVSDTNWTKEFIPFTQPPVIDQNADPLLKLSVFSNPIAPAWVTSTSYALGYVVFEGGAEWQCTVAHTSGSASRPGIGADWKGLWRRKLYAEGDAITISSINSFFTAFVRSYSVNDVSYAANYPTDPHPSICIMSHTPTRLQDSAGYLSTENDKWAQVVVLNQSAAVAAGEYKIYSGNIYKSLVFIASASANPPDRPDLWEFVIAVPGSIPIYAPFPTITAGMYISHLGIVWEALTNVTPTLIIDGITGAPVAGVNWRLVDNLFLPGHGSAADSPGSAWKLSPRRDDKDFQISHGALTGNNNVGSQPIAMQGAWNINTYGTWSGVFNVQRSDDNGLTWETIRSYEAKADRNIADAGTEDAPCLLRLFFIQDGSTAASGGQRAVLTPEKQSISGYVQANTYVNGAVLTGTALTPVMSGLTPDWSEGAFSTVRGFPSTLSLHESRLCFAGTASNPVSLWLSQTDDLLNFEQGVDDTDSIFVTLAAPYQYPIRWIESQRRLFIGTAVALWVAGSETSDAALTPSNFNARTYAATGSSTLRPLLASESLFFTDRKGSRLHQLAFSADAESYEPIDLSRLAEHLTQPGIAQLAWQQTREPSLWAVTREGKLLQFSYSRRDNLMAWSQHTTSGGSFRNVAILPSDKGDDDVFFIVQRAGGSALERFPQHYQETQETGNTPGLTASPLFPYHYLDGISYRGTATTSLTVPATLIGQALTLLTVSAGGVVTSSTVTPSASPLTIASTTRAILGKPITSRLSSLPVDMPGNQSLTKRLHKIALSLFRSKGGTMFNAAAASAKPIPYPSTDLYTGWTEMLPDLGNKDEVQVHIVHADPYPFTVRAVALRMNQQER
jgi:hypothetical protein